MNNGPDTTARIEAAAQVPTVPLGARARLREFFELTKPRMNLLVLCTTAVGYSLAPRTHWTGLLHALIGTALTAASAAALNMYVERGYDALMPRTRRRPLPAGAVAPGEALWFGLALGVLGLVYLATQVNLLTALLGAITLCSYVLIYTPLKRITSLNTVVGAVPGAIPPVMGWCAACNELSPEAMALFAILFLWQMPHFLAIAILFQRDYAAAGFKMLPCVEPELRLTSCMIVVYSLALIPASLLPVWLGMAGSAYLFGTLTLDIAFVAAATHCAQSRQRIDARRLFLASIIYLPLLLAVMLIDKA